MNLITEIVYNKLSHHYSIKKSWPFKNAILKSPLLYAGGFLKEHYLYVMTASDINKQKKLPANLAIICLGDLELDETMIDLMCVPENTDLRTLFNDVQNIFTEYDEWDDLLNDLSYDYDGIKNILIASRSVLNGTLVIADVFFNIVAYTKDFLRNDEYIDASEPHRAPPNIIKILLEDSELTQLEALTEVFIYHDYNHGTSLCFNIFKNQQYYARLMLLKENFDYQQEHFFLLEHIGKKLNRIFAQVSTFSLPVPIYNNLRLVINDLLGEQHFDLSVIKQSLEKVDWLIDQDYQFIYIKPYFQNQHFPNAAYLCSQLEQMWPNSCANEMDGNIVVVINVTLGTTPNTLFRDLAVFLRDGLFKAGISRCFNGILNLKSGYHQAVSALEIGNIKNEMFWYYQFDDYILDFIITNSVNLISSESLCHHGLLTLIRFDEEKHTDYYNTLKTFMTEKYNSTHAAEKLYIHRTTLIDRIVKIQEIGKINLDDWNQRIQLMLSFEILEHNKPK